MDGCDSLEKMELMPGDTCTTSSCRNQFFFIFSYIATFTSLNALGFDFHLPIDPLCLHDEREEHCALCVIRTFDLVTCMSSWE